MAKYSGKQIIRAGECLADKTLKIDSPDVFDEAMDCLAYWRGLHAEPLEAAYKELAAASNGLEKHPIFSKRLKRADSIRSKLRIYRGMSLKRMQDIGGCRVVVSSNKKVLKLTKVLSQKNHVFVRNNYVKTPKEDGYRSIHLIGKYRSRDGREFPIEIQVRSILQHVWATGVEMIDICTNQSLKSGLGLEQWEVFFRKLSEIFVELDDIHFLNTLELEPLLLSMDAQMKRRKFAILVRELVHLERSLRLTKKLVSYTDLIRTVDVVLEDKPNNQGYYLVYLDLNKGSVEAHNFYGYEDIEAANQSYVELEKSIEGFPSRIAALVSTQAVGGIKEAYPNYFADAQKLLTYMKIFEVLYSRHESTLAKLTS